MEKTLQFHEMGLDDRILKAIAKLGWKEPTLIQEKAIPLALEGKDILARARTGSGKTAAYGIPVVHNLLHKKQTSKYQSVKALILTPTKELCTQAHKNLTELTSDCGREVKVVDISAQGSLENQRELLMENPDIVVGTPSRVLAHLKVNNLTVKDTLDMVVIDEADLVLSFGYQDDINQILKYLPKIYQTFMMSATLNDDVRHLKRSMLHNPVILKLEEAQIPEASQLVHYHLKCEEADKLLVIYTLIKLQLLKGKTVIFVNSVNKCYRLKLYFEQFSIPSCVLNSELPVNSRCRIVSQFNDGLYNLIIAADEQALHNPETTANINQDKKKKGKKVKQDKESGVSRGIDFQFVSNVINFDFPKTADSYIHRVGRTARGDNKGTALSLVSVKEIELMEKVEQILTANKPKDEKLFEPFHFAMEQIEGFRYRANDAMRAVTSVAIKDARKREITSEIVNCAKLKSYFEDNPRDLQVLRHDKKVGSAKVHSHMQNVPEYLVPEALKGMQRTETRMQTRRKGKPYVTKGELKNRKRKADPLAGFMFSGLSSSGKKQKRRKK